MTIGIKTHTALSLIVETGDAVKSYLGEEHITILSGIKVTAQTLLDNMAAYKDGYRAIDSPMNFKLDEEAIQDGDLIKLVSNVNSYEREKCLCICGIRNDSNRPGIHSGKSDIQKHSGILFF